MLKRIFIGLFLIAAIACRGNSPVNPAVEGSNNLQPTAKQSLIAREVVKLLENFHYKKIDINDSISSVILDNYLKSLDEGRNYLIAADIKEFEQYRHRLDDDLRDGDLNTLFRMFNVFQKRYEERLRFSLSKVDSTYDFSTNETYIYDRSKMPWFSSNTAADESWIKRVKYDLLNLKLAGSEDRVDKLKQRYENLLSQSRKTNSQDAFQIMMDAFTQSVDPHTNYFVPNNAQRFNEEMARTFEGIGARLQLENEVVKIVEIIPGGPAFKAKTLHVNDRIVGVAQGDDGEFLDITGWRLDATVAKIKGPAGTIVRLKIIPAGQELSAKPKIVSLKRDKVVLEEQSAKKEIKTITSNGKTYRIGLITIPGFYVDFKALRAKDPNYKSTTRDVRLILDTLKQEKVDGVLIDLRSNGGGSLLEAIELTGLFIKTGPVVQVRDARNNIEVDKDEDAGVYWTGPLGVMVDRFSASASEIFAGAIQDYQRGVILGTQTYGKGTVQSAIDMSRVIGPADKLLLLAQKNEKDQVVINEENAPEFGQINLTMAKFYRISGSSTQHKGIIPDIQFPMIFPADQFGESSEPSALPWDEIKPTAYKPLANLAAVKKQLASVHEKRMKSSPEYKYLLQDIEQFKKRNAETSVTLNEAKLKKERDEREAQTLARDNQRRALKGLPPLKKGEAKPKDDTDFIEDESLQVMADFIELGKQERFSLQY